MTPKTEALPSALRRIALLAALTDERLDALAQRCAWRRAAAGEEVVSRQSGDRGVYLVVAGRVRVTSYSAGGRQVTFRDVNAGDWFGEVAAIDGLPRSADVQALDDSELAVLPREVFAELLEREPAVAREVLQRLAGLVRSLSERVIELSTLGVAPRLQAELLRLAHEAGVQDNRARLDPAPRHADLASRISTYREQVSRELSRLQRSGLLARDGRALLVTDVAGLARAVEAQRSQA
ncbi:Crp/Fnr family transcriptional regulator [Caldimonas tepidiphila]|uniref:Crp/Fnr family transcriptional regulator n=1 Tax=Caldimonas tepidiphila TaxID=2315841 RepID=UPI000E5BFE96|nr:Crp/Fnr family transcriptional regulator [Caldimonas tepidiphila]